MALRHLGAGLMAGLGLATGAGAVVYCEVDPSKYFDPDALERGAKALREINASPHAKKVGGGNAAACVPRW